MGRRIYGPVYRARGQQIHRLHLHLRKNSLEILSHDSKQGDDIVDVIEGDLQ